MPFTVFRTMMFMPRCIVCIESSIRSGVRFGTGTAESVLMAMLKGLRLTARSSLAEVTDNVVAEAGKMCVVGGR